MREVSLGESERGLEVLGEVVDLLDGGDDGLVNVLLLLLPLGAESLSALLLGEELSLLVGRLGGLGLGEVGVVDGLGHLDGSNVDLGRGRDHVRLSDSSEGDTVDRSGARDEQETRVELLEEHDSLASVSSGEEDQDSSRGDRGSERGGLRDLSVELGRLDVLGRVVLGRLGGRDETGLSVLASADLLLGVGGGLLLLNGSLLLGAWTEQINV